MDAHGHQLIANVGERLLRSALQQSNPKKGAMRIGAFYFGNWLTDVSQCVDPVAYRSAGNKLKGVGGFFKRLADDVPSWVLLVDPTGLTRLLRDQLRQAQTFVEACAEAVLLKGTTGELAKLFRFIFYYKGFFKFVPSGKGDGSDDLDPKVFDAIFEKRYRPARR
jgi:hypothetical protein